MPPQIVPSVKTADQECKNKDQDSREFKVDNFLCVVDDEGACPGDLRVVARSQPDLEVGEGTIPIEELNDECEGEPRQMKDFDRPVFSSPDGSRKEKEDPEKVDQDNGVGKDPVNHLRENV